MKYAIIAAGEGSRLAQEGIATPKPLVKVGGECLVDRLTRIFLANGAREVYVVCNSLSAQVSSHLRRCQQQGVPLRVVVKTTPSSMHSMYELAPLLDGDEPFVLTTVDTVFDEADFSRYVAELQRATDAGEADGLMGITDYIDDEKPLYVSTDGHMITAFNDRDDTPHYVSAGIYGLTPRALITLRACIKKGESRMRNFQRALLADGARLKVWPFATVLDIDHASDVIKAEELLKVWAEISSSHKQRILAVLRAERFSPNAVAKDSAIMMAVVERLLQAGNQVDVVSEDADEFCHLPLTRYGVVLSMGRLSATLQRLRELGIANAHRPGQQSVIVINSPDGVERCGNRCVLMGVMIEMGVPMPPAWGAPKPPKGECKGAAKAFYDSKAGPELTIPRPQAQVTGYPCWLKRADATTQEAGDVLFVPDAEALSEGLAAFQRRGIQAYTVSKHVEGDVVKFYGVGGTGFFRYYYPTDDGDLKFANEQHNGAAHHYGFDAERLHADAERLARGVGVMVYGGDCIVSSDGSYSMVDFNDWPSYSRCREEAADAICRLVRHA